MPFAWAAWRMLGCCAMSRRRCRRWVAWGPWRAWRSGSGIWLGWCPLAAPALRYLVVPRGRTGMPCSWASFLQCRCGAAGLGGDVGEGAVPGQVLLAQPVQFDADGIGVLGGVRGGPLAAGVEAPPD